ncbi:hypothetical protein ICN84_05040 [Akkermansia glycaniphila]|uniref:hypothetical protein n=1 Tax=Akkermansia glycaniphila TaxID=1679444 RepID=UPI001C01CC9A|nr:hypothetical protein [Akkermansia glycaniphila]MBT9449439.1 hypothetical protein [Akkermansia glycaniphila]
MLRHLRLILLTAAAAAACTSCSICRTSLDVAERGTTYEGYEITGVDAVWQKGGNYYVRCPHKQFRLHYPWVKDPVFRPELQPAYIPLPQEGETLYAFHRISPDVAYALVHTNGFDMLNQLHTELDATPDAWIPEPSFSASGVRRIPSKAIVGDKDKPSLQTAAIRSEKETSSAWAWQTLAVLDAIVVDIPGTALYNIAMPLIAPYRVIQDISNDNNLY